MQRWTICSGLTALMLLAGCGGDQRPYERRFEVTGLVVETSEAGTVSVAHEAVADYMPAMLMPFTLEDSREGDTLSPGDRVRFTLRVTADASRASDFVVTGRDLRTLRAYGAARASEAQRVRPGNRLPPFELLDQDASPFTDTDLAGQPTVLTFIFTRCPLPEFCPLVITRLLQVQHEPAADPALAATQIVAVTLDPAFDTPAILTEYGRARRVDLARWRLATGTADRIAALTSAFALHVDPTSGPIDHTLATALIDADGRIVEIWRGTYWDVREVLDALRRLPLP